MDGHNANRGKATEGVLAALNLSFVSSSTHETLLTRAGYVNEAKSVGDPDFSTRVAVAHVLVRNLRYNVIEVAQALAAVTKSRIDIVCPSGVTGSRGGEGADKHLRRGVGILQVRACDMCESCT